MNLQEFRLTDPVTDGASFFLSSSNEVTHINMSFQGCSDKNLSDIIANSDNIVFDFSPPVTFNVLSSEIIGNTHYHLTLNQPYNTLNTSSLNENSTCYGVTLAASETENIFDNSDFDPLQNNTDTSRVSKYIFQVDKPKENLAAANIELINAKSASLAETPDSNYTSKGFTTSRYDGSKNVGGLIVIDDPALQFRSFEASVFISSSTNTEIISGTVDPIKKQELFFTPKVFKGVRYSDTFHLFQNSTQAFPATGMPVYEDNGRNFVRIINKRVYVEEIGKIFNTNNFGIVELDDEFNENIVQGSIVSCIDFFNSSNINIAEFEYSSSASDTSTITLERGEGVVVTVHNTSGELGYRVLQGVGNLEINTENDGVCSDPNASFYGGTAGGGGGGGYGSP